MPRKGKILVVDDNAGIRAALKLLLPLHFAEAEYLPSPVELISRTANFRPDAILLDMNFNTDINSGNEGLFWLSELKKSFPEVKVVLFTAYADISLAVEGMKRGAFDFIVKPWENDKLVAVLQSACSDTPKKSDKGATAGLSEMFWGSSPAMSEILRTLDKIAATDASVLITGENGTGKDVMAAEIHRRSLRSAGPLVSVDAGAIPETLFESELFGHIKGAFTDAKSDHAGKFEQADGGTLFLDEIGNIPLSMQPKLLRVLQNRSVTRVGDSKSLPVDIRLICATNMDPDRLVAEGAFREDLYYRINTIHIVLPALRDRPDDIVPLAEIFLKRFAEKYRRGVTGISADGARTLCACRWPGNIRELQNCIEKAVILSDGGLLGPVDLQIPPSERGAASPSCSPQSTMTLDEAEEKAVRAAMDKYGGNLSLVAKALDISRPTLYSKLKKYGI